jgi:hypothetical protein
VGPVLYFGGGCVIVIYSFFFKYLGLNNVGIHSPFFSSK